MIGPAVAATGEMTTQRSTQAAVGRLPSFLKGENGVPNQEKVNKFMNQSLSDQWWIKRQGRLSMNATWVNSNIFLRIPSAKAAAIVETMDLTNIDAEFLKKVEDFLVETFGKDFHGEYQTLNAPDSQNRELQNILRAFQYHLELSIGAEDIASNTVTQTLLINRNMQAHYDFQNQPKGKDAKRFITLVTEQFVKKKKAGYAQMAAGYLSKSKAPPEKVVHELETGKKDQQDVVNVTHILGQSRDNRGEKRFEVWLKKLREIEGLPIFAADSKDAKEYLKKLNFLKGEIEKMLKARAK